MFLEKLDGTWQEIDSWTLPASSRNVFRIGSRGGYLVYDQEIDATGFDGAIGVNWDNIEQHALSVPSGHVFNTSDSVRTLNAGTTMTLSYTCGVSATVLVLGIFVDELDTRPATAPTYNSAAMTDSGQGVVNETNGDKVELWYLLNPDVGSAHDITLDVTAGQYVTLIAASFSADTSNFDTSSSVADTVANPSLAITTTGNGCVIVNVLCENLVNAPTEGQTLVVGVDSAKSYYSMQYFLQEAAGSKTMTWTADGGKKALINISIDSD